MTHDPPPIPAEIASLADQAILARAVSGDGAAFELLMRRHNQRLYRVARAVVHDDLEAEDIVQDAFVRAFAHLARFEGRSSVATWLTRIVFHEALRRRRRRIHAQRTAISSGLATHPAAHDLEAIPDMAGRSETRTMLTQALDSLAPELRTVVVLRLVQGLSTRETAECLRLSEANVKARLHRGRRLLMETMQRQIVPELSQQYAFGSERCDRVVDAVLHRIGILRSDAAR